MPDAKLSFIVILLLPLLGGVTVNNGCDADGDPRLRFSDASAGCGASEDHLERPLALGAELALNVAHDGAAATLVRATSQDPGVFDVVDLPDAAVPRDPSSPRGRVVVRGVAPGQARLDVVDALLRDGAVTLSVAEVATSTLAPDDLAIWNLDRELASPHPDVPASLLAGGVVLLPDGRLSLSVTLQDAAGTPLIGHGVANVAAAPDGIVTLTRPDPLSDNVAVGHTGVSGDVVATAAGGGRYAVRLADDVPGARLAAYVPALGQLVDDVSVEVGETLTVVLLAFDADDRVVLGSGPAGFTAEVSGPSTANARLIDPPWAEPRGEIELDADGRALLSQARVVHVEGMSAGPLTLQLSALGTTLELPVEVSP